MSNNLNSKKISKPFGILIAILALVLIAIVTTMGITGAWFTGNDNKTKDSPTPHVSVALNNVSGTEIQQVITLTTSTTVSLLVDGNIDTYLRAKVVPQFVDSEGHFITCYNISDYFTITYNNKAAFIIV